MTHQVIRFPLPIPREHSSFSGHFPGDPLVAGALLLQWLVDALVIHLPGWVVVGAPSVKFISPVRPGDHLQVELKHQDDTARFVLTRDTSSVCQGKLELRPADE